MIHGIDLSDNNGTFNWNSVAIDFAIVKATQGITDHDSQFARNWAAMASKGLMRGAYHYMTAAVDPVLQAEYFVNFVKAHGLGAHDALVLDMETNIPNVNIKSFVSKVQALTQKNVWIYSEYSIINEGKFAGLYNNPLWIANPGGRIGAPPPVHPFPVWTAQQYTWTPFDHNVFNGTRNTWSNIVNLKTPAVRESVTADGKSSLVMLANRVGTTPAEIILETVETAHTLGSALTPYLNEILEGQKPFTLAVPKGTILYYLKG